MTGRRRGVLIGHVLPGDSRAENPVHHGTVVLSRSMPPTGSSEGLGNRRLDNFSLLVLETHTHPSSACLRQMALTGTLHQNGVLEYAFQSTPLHRRESRNLIDTNRSGADPGKRCGTIARFLCGPRSVASMQSDAVGVVVNATRDRSVSIQVPRFLTSRHAYTTSITAENKIYSNSAAQMSDWYEPVFK